MGRPVLTCESCNAPATTTLDGEAVCSRCELSYARFQEGCADSALGMLSAAVTVALSHAAARDVLALVEAKVANHQAPYTDEEVGRLRSLPLDDDDTTLAALHNRLHAPDRGRTAA